MLCFATKYTIPLIVVAHNIIGETSVKSGEILWWNWGISTQTYQCIRKTEFKEYRNNIQQTAMKHSVYTHRKEHWKYYTHEKYIVPWIFSSLRRILLWSRNIERRRRRKKHAKGRIYTKQHVTCAMIFHPHCKTGIRLVESVYKADTQSGMNQRPVRVVSVRFALFLCIIIIEQHF